MNECFSTEKSAADIEGFLFDYCYWYLEDNKVVGYYENNEDAISGKGRDDTSYIVEGLKKKYGSYDKAYQVLQGVDAFGNQNQKEKYIDNILRSFIVEIKIHRHFDRIKKEYDLILAAENGDETALYKLWLKAYGNARNAKSDEQIIEGCHESIYWAMKMQTRTLTDSQLQYDIGYCFLMLNDYNQSFDWFIKARENGNKDAKKVLLEKNEYLKLLAQSGEIEAQRELGERYYDGTNNNNSIDIEKAVKWMTKAAEQGDYYSQSKLAYWYLRGGKIPLNYSKALEWLIKAYQQKETPTMAAKIGDCYFYDTEIRDYKKAVEYYKKSAEIGYSMEKLEECYRKGYGVEQSNEKADEWKKKAKQYRNRLELEKNLMESLAKDNEIEDYTDAFGGYLDAEWNID